MDWTTALEGRWLWLSLGIVLGAAEMLAPGFFLIWLAAAAILTGLVAWLLPISMTVQIVLFAILAIGLVQAGRRWFRGNPIESDDPLLNDRGARMVGDVVIVVEPIKSGTGRVTVGDSVWTANGPDTPVGARVRITGVHGSTLQVEPA